MARRRRTDAQSDRQPSLFDLVKEDQQDASDLVPGSFNISYRLCAEISEGLKRSTLSRYEVAAKMSELIGVEITKSQLDSWTAESKECHRFPAEYLPAYCAVTGYKEPLQMMARLVQCFLLESEEALLAELGRIDQKKRDLTKREKAVREYLSRVKAEGHQS